MRSVYPIGFVTASGTHVFISMISFDQQFSMGALPASVIAFAGGIFLALSVRFMPESRRTQNTAAWGQTLISLFWRGMQRLLDMDWFFALSQIVIRIVRRVFLTFSFVLENNGGLIWEILLMILLLAAAFTGSAL